MDDFCGGKAAHAALDWNSELRHHLYRVCVQGFDRVFTLEAICRFIDKGQAQRRNTEAVQVQHLSDKEGWAGIPAGATACSSLGYNRKCQILSAVGGKQAAIFRNGAM